MLPFPEGAPPQTACQGFHRTQEPSTAAADVVKQFRTNSERRCVRSFQSDRFAVLGGLPRRVQTDRLHGSRVSGDRLAAGLH